eukprot:gb/GFBE01045497.1/.p1 GENE.gb/GFBE01045497.1/~~gb/GFBE01045497.1/.p1  ORF type:complete len:594 (+),score=146.16 gb/GFBE01045497.1/:1-1782(+)
MNLQRADSEAYWDSEAWNPDDRVYVGASDGQTNHLRAVEYETESTATAATAASTAKATEDSKPVRSVEGGSVDYWDQAFQSQTPSGMVLSMPGGPALIGGQAGVRTEQSSGGGYGGGGGGGGMHLEKEGSSYWDDYRDPQPGQMPAKPVPGEEQQSESQNKQEGLKRVNSGAYWDADQWDPDNRIYVGAEAGQTHHLQAVDPKDSADTPLWRVWSGGLASAGLGLGEKVGPAIDLKTAGLTTQPTLQDLYDIHDESVGSGSFGIVRKSRHKSSSTDCVIKSVNKMAAGERYRHSIVDEGLGQKLLSMSMEAKHPNVALYLDMLEGEKCFYVIMEELKGAELMDQVEELFPVTEAYLQRVMKQILQALSHIHDKVGLVHRDVKLSNFRFRSTAPDADLALLDFGFACSPSEKWDGGICGTMMFMAPEVVGKFAAVPHLTAIDVWAAGVILYVLLTGDAPADEDQVRLFGNKAKKEEAQEILEKALGAELLSRASAESLALLTQMLVLDPAARSTAADALKHRWFSTDGSERKVTVPTDKYRLVRSSSSLSIGSPASGSSPGKGKGKGKKTLGLPKPSFNPMERIVSEGVEELKP